jgi:hypothetical protein
VTTKFSATGVPPGPPSSLKILSMQLRGALYRRRELAQSAQKRWETGCTAPLGRRARLQVLERDHYRCMIGEVLAQVVSIVFARISVSSSAPERRSRSTVARSAHTPERSAAHISAL